LFLVIQGFPGSGGLELQAEGELADTNVANLSRRADGGRDLAKGRCVVDDVRRAAPRIGEVWVVEDIEEIRTEGQVDAFGRDDGEDLGKAEIEIGSARSVQKVT